MGDEATVFQFSCHENEFETFDPSEILSITCPIDAAAQTNLQDIRTVRNFLVILDWLSVCSIC